VLDGPFVAPPNCTAKGRISICIDHKECVRVHFPHLFNESRLEGRFSTDNHMQQSVARLYRGDAPKKNKPKTILKGKKSEREAKIVEKINGVRQNLINGQRKQIHELLVACAGCPKQRSASDLPKQRGGTSSQ